MDPPGDALDALAGALRDRLVDGAGDAAGGDDPARADRCARRARGRRCWTPTTRAALADRVAERAVGLGPLEPLLRDAAVDELMVCGTAPVWVERGGRLAPTDVRFGSEAELRHVDRAHPRAAGPAGRRGRAAVRRAAAGRLARERRAAAARARRAAADDPRASGRAGSRRPTSSRTGRCRAPLLEFLGRAVAARCTLLICGGTGSGKTTTLGALAAFVDPAERVVTIEDAAELRLGLPHVVRLEARPPNLEGRGEVTIRRLVSNALRMRPDRLIVGEVRGPEALDLLVALGTGHAGSLCTIHAGSAAEALRRLETLALMADIGLPLAAIREQVADAIDLVVRQERGAGRRPPRRRGRRGRARGRRPGGARAVHAARGPARVARAAGRLARGPPRRARRPRCARVPPAPLAAMTHAAWLAAGAACAGVVGVWEALAAVERTRVAAAAARVLEPLARAGARGARADARRSGGACGRSPPRRCWPPAGCVGGPALGRRSRRSPARPPWSPSSARAGAAGATSCAAPRPRAPARWPTRSAPAGRSAARSPTRRRRRTAPPRTSSATAARALALGEPTEAVLDPPAHAGGLRTPGTR